MQKSASESEIKENKQILIFLWGHLLRKLTVAACLMAETDKEVNLFHASGALNGNFLPSFSGIYISSLSRRGEGATDSTAWRERNDVISLKKKIFFPVHLKVVRVLWA